MTNVWLTGQSACTRPLGLGMGIGSRCPAAELSQDGRHATRREPAPAYHPRRWIRMRYGAGGSVAVWNVTVCPGTASGSTYPSIARPEARGSWFHPLEPGRAFSTTVGIGERG